MDTKEKRAEILMRLFEKYADYPASDSLLEFTRALVELSLEITRLENAASGD